MILLIDLSAIILDFNFIKGVLGCSDRFNLSLFNRKCILLANIIGP